MKDKKSLLFKQMCIDAEVQDDDLLDTLVTGVKLTGQGEPSGQFEEDIRTPSLTNEQLMRTTRWSRKAVMKKQSTSASATVRQTIWDGALEEVEKGWLTGPLTEEEAKQLLGPLFVVPRRFGLEQSDKVRAIDDMSESLVNATYGSSYKLARFMLSCVKDSGAVQIRLSSGEFLRGLLHHSLSVTQARALVGCTLDLDAAGDSSVVALGVGHCSRGPGFNRVARAMWAIGTKLFGLIWANYFDDYPQLDLQASDSNAQAMAGALLDIRRVGSNF